MILIPQWLRGKSAGLALAACCLTIVAAACNSSEQKVASARDNVAAANQDLNEASRDARVAWQEDWVKFKGEINEDLSKNERRILDLRAEVAKLDTQYQEQYTTRINDAERRNVELRDRVNNYQDQGDEKWAVFKTDVRQDFDDLEVTIRNIDVRNS